MVDLSVVFRKRLPGRVTRIHPDFPQMMFSSRDIADIPEEYHALIPTGAYWAYWNMNESGMIKLEFPKRYFKRRDVKTCSRFPFSKCTAYCVYIYIPTHPFLQKKPIPPSTLRKSSWCCPPRRTLGCPPTNRHCWSSLGHHGVNHRWTGLTRNKQNDVENQGFLMVFDLQLIDFTDFTYPYIIVIWLCVKTLYPCSSHQNSW